jgi:hypothetical protein
MLPAIFHTSAEFWSLRCSGSMARRNRLQLRSPRLAISIPAVATFSDLFARLGPDPRVRCKQFEHVCKWFLINDPTYKNTLRRVWLWNEWTGRWGGDAGIDLIAEDQDGRLWAIQAKAYAPRTPSRKPTWTSSWQSPRGRCSPTDC